MYDIHAHILPGVDDGAADWEMALRMLDMAVADGVKGIVATPHVETGKFEPGRETVLALVAELKERAGTRPIEIYPGSELMFRDDTLGGVVEGRRLTLNGGRYVLVELPGWFVPDAVYDFVFSLTSRGYTPIIAHPERNLRVQGDMGALCELVRLGALTQLTGASLLGLFGPDAKKAASEMLKRRLAHVIASDAHTDNRRTPVLSAAFKEAAKVVGVEKAREMVDMVPRMILSSQPYEPEEPVAPKGGFFRLFSRG